MNNLQSLYRKLFCVLSVLAVCTASADNDRLPLRHCCEDAELTKAAVRTRASVSTPLQGDVCIPIILAAYQDVPFSIENVREVWDEMANKHGYSEHGANGCMADYFYEQSYGQLRVTFDVIGPVTLSENRAYYGGNNDAKAYQMIQEACRLADQLPGVDFSRYWGHNGYVETALVVYAGVGENVVGAPEEVIWPKQNYAGFEINDKFRLWVYACANELVWPNMRQEGFGPLIHEFSHCLGLRDLYNVDESVKDYIYFDEWDLMDGGCYSNDSWGPVGYSAYERYLCGWMQLEELEDTDDIDGLEALSDGGMAYKLSSPTSSEYLILENRQQQSYDTYLPGHGLLVTHVGAYSSDPNYGSRVTVYPIPADGLSYPQCVKKYVQDYYGVTLPDESLNLTSKYKKYLYDENGRNRMMAGAAFPYVVDGEIVCNSLTMYGKTVNHIHEREGLISFHVAPEGADAVMAAKTDARPIACYDLHGRPSDGFSPGIYIIRYSDGTIQKVIR